MKKEYKCGRRLFIKNSIAATAGLVILGSGIKLFAKPADEWYWYAFCCKRCDICKACNGCKTNLNPNSPCGIKNCAIGKNVPTCAHCEEVYTCDKFNDELWPELRQGAIELREELIEQGRITSIIQSNNNNNFNIFPNPAHSSINVQLHGLSALYLYSIDGSLVAQTNSTNDLTKINISNLSNGLYIIKAIDKENKVSIGKFQKQ